MSRRRRRFSRKRVPRKSVAPPPGSAASVAVAPAPPAEEIVAVDSPPLTPPSAIEADATEPPRVLAVFPDTSVLRLIRESIGAFTDAIADTTPDASFGFELAMQRDYRMFFFGVDLPVLGGEQLYDFIAKAYAHCRPAGRAAPGVVYLTGADARNIPHELCRDARVKAVLSCPFEIARLLSCTDGTLARKEITA